MSRRRFNPQSDFLEDRDRDRGVRAGRWLLGTALVAVIGVAALQYGPKYWPISNDSDSAPGESAASGKATPRRAGSGGDNTRKQASVDAGAGRADAHGPNRPARGGGRQATNAARQKASERPPLQRVGPLGAVPLAAADTPPGSTIAAWCTHIADLIDSVARSHCLEDGFMDTGHRSVEGRPIVLRRVAADSLPAVGRVLLLGATHGDEPSTTGMVFAWLKLMIRQGTPFRWNIAPMLNPDGALHHPATRVNAHGVDLNRNLPTTGWAKKSRAYWRRVGFEKRRFPGKSPGSEPENRWLVDEIRTYRPDVIVTLHAPYGVLDYDGTFPPPHKIGRLHLHRLGVYPGSLGNFASRMKGIPVMTIELENARSRPSDKQLKAMWADLNGWLGRYMRSVRQASAEDAADAG